MDEVIKSICNSLKEEAEAVSEYTDRISKASHVEGFGATVELFEKTRLDEVEHMQNLVIELTKIMSTGALSAALMNEGNEEETEEE